MSNMNLDCFIFDFDGTLAYSEAAYREAFRHAISLHTGLELPESELKGFSSMTPPEILGRYSGPMLEEMLASFEQHYYANHHQHLVPYDGVRDLLEGLNRLGAGIAIVSLKPRRAGERELDITGLRSLINTAVWGDDVQRPKPEPDGVLRAITVLGGDACRTMVIGDSPADIAMGRAAGTRTGAVLWSGSDAEELMAARPDLALSSPGDLLAAITGVTAK